MYEKREHQQEKLVKAACELAAEKGIGALRTRAIAAKAGVSVGTLHYCFETKEELLRALYRYVRAEFRTSLDGILYGESVAPETLSAMTRARVHLLENQTTAFKAWRAFTREAWTDPTVKEIVKEHFAEQRARIEAALLREQQSPPVAEGRGPCSGKEGSARVDAAILVSIYEGLNVQWTIDPDAFSLDEYSRAIAQIHGLKDDG